MDSQHQRHLFATYLALVQLAEEIRTLALRGIAPGAAARRLPPLPEEEWAALEPDLQALLDEARAAVARYASPMLEGHERATSRAATRRWIAVLLGRAADLAAELEPDRISRRFGEIHDEE